HGRDTGGDGRQLKCGAWREAMHQGGVSMENIRNKVAVVGVGTTEFGRLPGNDAYDLGVKALKSALDDAGMKFSDIDGLIVSRIPDYQRFGELTGINPRVSLVTPGQGRMSGASIAMAASLILSGQATTV